MDKEKEGLEPQKIPEEVSILKEELEDLKHRAEVSTQNFERLKKAEEDKAELKAQVEELQGLQDNNVPLEDEEMRKIRGEISDIKGKLIKSEVIESYPQLKGVWKEFEEYHSEPDNRGMNMRTAAKAFLADKGLLESTRKGLEKPVGGPRNPPSSGMTSDDIKTLREQSPKKYYDMLKKGLIKIG